MTKHAETGFRVLSQVKPGNGHPSSIVAKSANINICYKYVSYHNKKLHTRKNKNNLLRHGSYSVQTQDYQISREKRNILCLELKDCMTHAKTPAHS